MAALRGGGAVEVAFAGEPVDALHFRDRGAERVLHDGRSRTGPRHRWVLEHLIARQGVDRLGWCADGGIEPANGDPNELRRTVWPSPTGDAVSTTGDTGSNGDRCVVGGGR